MKKYSIVAIMMIVLLVCIRLYFLYSYQFTQHTVKAQDKSTLIQSLYAQHILDHKFTLVRFSQICILTIDAHIYPVYDSRELIPNASEPGGNNYIVVTDNHGNVKKVLNYVDAEPLLCNDNKLFLMETSDMLSDYEHTETYEGNTLSFSNDAQNIVSTSTDWRNIPSYTGQ